MLTKFGAEQLTPIQRGYLIYLSAYYDINATIAERFAKILSLLFFKIPVELSSSSVQNSYLSDKLSRLDTTIQQLWEMRNGSVSKEKATQIRENAQEDFDAYFAVFDAARKAEIDALMRGNSSKALNNTKKIGPDNHSQIFKESLYPLYQDLGKFKNTLPLKYNDYIIKRWSSEDDWQKSIDAIFYYSALCGAFMAEGKNNKQIIDFHSIIASKYASIYTILKQDILIAEAIRIGD
jgi:hypothetical protein